MKRRFGTIAISVSVVLWCAATAAFGGAIEDAKALLADKKYDQVDKALEKELAQRVVPNDILKVSLDAALGGGKLYTAQRRINALLTATENKDLALVFLGGQIADLTVDYRTAQGRFLLFAQQQKDKSDNLEYALRYVASRDACPVEYKKYVETFGATDKAWDLGMFQMDKLFEIPDAEKALDLADFLAKKFPQPKRIDILQAKLRAGCDSYALGKTPKDRFLAPLTILVNTVPSDYTNLAYLFTGANPTLTDDQRVALVFAAQKATKAPLGGGLVSYFSAIKTLATPEAKLKAGKDFLALEPIYRDSNNRDDYAWFTRVIGEWTDVFNVKDQALVSGKEALRMADALIAKYKDAPQSIRANVQLLNSGYMAADAAASVEFLKKNITLISDGSFGDLLRAQKGEDLDSLLTSASAGRTYKEVLDLRLQCMDWYNQKKEKEKLLAVVREYVTAYPALFNWQTVKGPAFDGAALSQEEKVALLEELANKGGSSAPLKALMDELAKDKTWAADAKFNDLKKGLKDKAGSDGLMVANIAMTGMKDRTRVTMGDLSKKALADYKGQVPGGMEMAKNAEEISAYSIFYKQIEALANDQDKKKADFVSQCAELWAPRMGYGPGFDWLVFRTREQAGGAALYKIVPAALALVKGANTGTAALWRELSNTVNPAGAKSAFSDVYPIMGAANAANYVMAQKAGWSENRAYWLDELAKVLAMPGVKLAGKEQAGAIAQFLLSGASAQNKVPAALIKAVADQYFAEADKAGAYDPQTEATIYALYTATGLTAEAGTYMTGYLDRVAKRTVPQQVEAVTGLFRYTTLLQEDKGKLTPGQRFYITLKVLKPLYEKLPKEAWGGTLIHWGIVDGIAQVLRDWPDGEAKTDAAAEAHVVMDMLLAGARYDGYSSWVLPLVDLQAKDALARGDYLSLGRLLAYHADALAIQGNWTDNLTNFVLPMTKRLDEAGAYESEYAYLAMIEKKAKVPEKVLKQLLIVKAKASSQIPGLILASPSDPMYDLHVAANALSIGNETRAWELTAPKLVMLTKNWETVDADYVSWVVEQMRKQKLLKDALEFAFTILTREADLDPDLAAKVFLTKGDIYRDMENYQAARVEYEGLRNSPRYKKTEAGAKAAYRLIDLLIVTKDYSTADGFLERLVDSDNVEVQAEAYYLHAKMAYLQGDFKAAKEYLKKVKERTVSHVEAAFLEGELNLLLPGGLQHTEVEVGAKRLSTVAIPGRTLTLKLQDTNLSIARGGAAIPVVIRTSKGQDEERIKLLPASDDKTLFVGMINTALGKVVKGDLVLQLRGDDEVSYEIDPEFQKANGISYPPKTLEVKYDAYLAASSGEILTEEEEEKASLEKQLQRGAEQNIAKYEQVKDSSTVRPGSKIYVQVTDFAADVSDDKGKVYVDLRTSSGETLEGFELLETDVHSGLYRGAVPTLMPRPKATASDSEEGKTPASLISAGKQGPWTSLGDGKKPKWFEVDTMSSYQVKTASMDVAGLSGIKQVTLLGLLGEDYEELACFPPKKDVQNGGFIVELAPDRANGLPDALRRHVKLRSTDTVRQDGTAFDRNETPFKGKPGGLTARMTGAFFLPDNRTIEFRFMPEGTSRGTLAYLFVDDQQVLGCTIDENTLKITRQVDLTKGPHKVEILLSDSTPAAKVTVGYLRDDGVNEVLPATWFNPKENADLAEYLKPKGQFVVKDDTLSVTLDEPRRLRKLKWVFDDFSGNAITIKQLSVLDDKDQPIVPLKEETATSSSSALRISPGDEITVSYNDPKGTRPDMAVISKKLRSSFFNGTCVLANEVIVDSETVEGRKDVKYFPVKRCRKGDQLAVIVTDYDEDTSDQRDTVDVTVRTSSGETLVIKALETDVSHQAEEREIWNRHAGVFLGTFKLGDTTTKDTIKLSRGDQLIVSYIDKENTKPGIPTERKYAVFEASGGKPSMLVYNTEVKQEEDKSPEARAKVLRMKTKGATTAPAMIYKDVLVAKHPDYVTLAPAGKGAAAAPASAPASAPAATAVAAAVASTGPASQPVVVVEKNVSVAVPLLFEVTYPKFALNAGSVLKISALADSEVAAAAKEKRKAKPLLVPLYVEGIETLAKEKGYQVRLMSHIRRSAEDMLRDGVFAGVVRLQMGSPGDPVDDLVVSGEKEFATGGKELKSERDEYHYRVPTLLVSGSDVVTLNVLDEKNEVVASSRLRLLSDARLELMDATYTAQCEAIHLGDKFFVKVTDPDRDLTDARDTVTVKVKSSSGAGTTMILTETMAHSGVFTGSIKPEFAGGATTQPASAPAVAAAKQAATEPADSSLLVNFGDQLTFEYVDVDPLTATEPVSYVKTGTIYRGFDGQLALFSKRFKDPEMAVKTNFLTAEALFEMAKEHRKLQQKEKADEEIARGKRILEEAMRDYPNTSLAAQGEYLLANLAQELESYQEAIGRYANVISSWPESEYAARSQFKKAICFEKMGNNEQACEEYVKVIYIYPDSGLVADATVRLGNYYYRQNAFRVAGMIFYKFQQKNATNPLAAKSLFLASQCYYKMNDFADCIKLFGQLVEQYPDEKDLRAEAMYWLADSFTKTRDYPKAYQNFKKLTWDYPESQWAKIARGRLTEEVFEKME